MWDLRGLFTKYACEIERAMRGRGHSADTAADLTQHTFLRILSAKSQTPPRNPQAYLHQIARNLSVDHYRRIKRSNIVDVSEEVLLSVADTSPSHERVLIDRQNLLLIEQALMELPEKTRLAFELYQTEDKTISEVATEIGLSVSRTWVLIRNAYLHLRKRLDESEN